ncbi:alpha/beta hydrolase [Myxococcota bacterium]|nr:alpha/beta hydrolase [Myxococcota bacterium]
MSQRNYDPDFDELLPLLPTVTDFSSLEAVQEMRANRANMLGEVVDRDDVDKDDRVIPGPADSPDVPIRIYRSKVETDGPRPGVFEIHGGGFMMGSIDMMDAWCQRVAAELDVVVVSVEYRLAPEDPYPAGVEDCYAALAWMAAQADALGVDPKRIAVAGQSAGGGLAAATALLARDRGGPELCFQLLEIPELDDRLDTPSMLAFTDTPLWNLPNARWSWRHYLGPNHQGEVSPYAAPARAEDLSGLPPAYVSTMEFDPLRDEGILYATRMLQAGISVELHSFPGTFHGSALLPGAEVSKRSLDEVIGVLRRRLAA